MQLPRVKELVADDQKVTFVRYQNGALWYRCDLGFEFPVPVGDTGDGIFLPEHKAIGFMRWIRKHLQLVQDAMTGGE